LNRGIIVDNALQTNIPDVYAAGDVAEAYDFILAQNRTLPLWPLAIQEGKIAGSNMAGQKTSYSGGTSMSSLKYFGIPIVSIGLANPKEDPTLEVLTQLDVERKVYKKIVLKNNLIVGLTMVGQIELSGVLFYLMKNAINVKKFKNQLVADNFGLATLPVSLQKKMSVIM
jgi:NAD(P)H-nitrite reductase large subunit